MSDASVGELTAPKFTQPLKDLAVKSAQRVCLQCRVSGHPLPEVQWFMDNKQLESSPDFQVHAGIFLSNEIPTSRNTHLHFCHQHDLLFQEHICLHFFHHQKSKITGVYAPVLFTATDCRLHQQNLDFRVHIHLFISQQQNSRLPGTYTPALFSPTEVQTYRRVCTCAFVSNWIQTSSTERRLPSTHIPVHFSATEPDFQYIYTCFFLTNRSPGVYALVLF